MPLDDLFLKTYAPDQLTLLEQLPKRTDTLQDKLLANLEARTRSEAERDRVASVDSASMTDPMQALLAQVAPALLPGAPMWLRALAAIPSGGQQVAQGGMPLGPVGAKQILSPAQQEEHLRGMMGEVKKIASGFAKSNSNFKPQHVDDMVGEGYLALAEALSKGIPESLAANPDQLKAHLSQIVRNNLKDWAKREMKFIPKDELDFAGGLVDEAGEVGRQLSNTGEMVGGKAGVHDPEAIANFAPEILGDLPALLETPNAVKGVTSSARSIARDLYTRGMEQKAVGLTRRLDPINLDRAIKEMQNFEAITPAQELSKLGTREEIQAAISHAVKTSKSAKIRSFERPYSNPVSQYLLDDKSPLDIAARLGYKDKSFKDFSRQLQTVTNDVREILLKMKKP